MAPPPCPKTDVDLMAAVAIKDAAAESELLRRVGSRVRRVTGLLCWTAADAEDAAQQSLMEVLKSAGSFRESTSLERWADRITVRTTLRAARREHKRRGLLARWLMPGAQPWGGSSAHVTEPLGLDTVLGRLSPEQRRVFVLHHALDYTVDEIVELTCTPPGTVKDRLVSARKQLRRMLEDGAARGGKP